MEESRTTGYYRPINEDDPLEVAVRQDIVHGLEGEFDECEGGFQVLDGGPWTGPIHNEEVSAVVWRFNAAATSRLVGAASPEPIDIEGTSFVIGDIDEALFKRYIDWHGALSEIGLFGATRIPDPEEVDAASAS